MDDGLAPSPKIGVQIGSLVDEFVLVPRRISLAALFGVRVKYGNQ